MQHRRQPERTTRRVATSVLGLLLLAPASAGGGSPAEVWIVGQCPGRISVVDTVDRTVRATIDVSDPDGDQVLDAPECIAFAADGTHAFVGQGRWITPVEASGRTVLAPYDLSVALGSGVQVNGCAAAVPRRFEDPTSGPVVSSHLFVAATTAAGVAVAAILDQDALIAGSAGGDPLVDTVVLRSGAVARDVAVLTLPSGNHHQRAFYTVASSSEIITIEVYLQERPGGARVGSIQILGEAAPALGLAPSAPLGGEFAVIPQGSGGPLLNPLPGGGTCDVGGEVVAVGVAGVGDNSYTVAAVDSASLFRLVDPTDCALSTPITAGTDPAALVMVGGVDWDSAWVLNRGSANATVIDREANVSVVDLCPSPGPLCNPCPVDGAAAQPICEVDDLRVLRLDTDGNGLIDTYRVSWDPIGCPSGAEYAVSCKCIGTVDCPCGTCDCSQPNQPASCQCPGFVLTTRSATPRGGLDPAPLLKADNDLPTPENPWIILGVTPLPDYDHEVDENAPGDWEYKVDPE